ncbi:MBL fold metallo-hydrolase [Candidatus Woesearchaeota archaeon]|jgi:putative mRNA 3-end processing factor|nr:MBL fold metallo-hydrolase [Candidatus Woesearchaeota archaeon]
MKIQFLGSAQEVGRSCIVVNDWMLFDAGIKIGKGASEHPQDFSEKDIKAVFISHAHLDHTGALPLLNHMGLRCVIYATKMTRAITKILLADSIHIEEIKGQHPAYTEENINNILSYFSYTDFNRWYEEKSINMRYKFYNAGHIPGSASILVEFDDSNKGGQRRKIFYTGDINATDTNLMQGLTYQKDKDLRNVDVMISETTYGGRDHPNREEQENEFLKIISYTLNNHGSVLIPAFAVGRSQEILLMLAKKNFNVPIYLDGMGKKVTDLCLNQNKFVRDGKAFRKAIDKVEYIKDHKQRKRIVQSQAIIVTTSGMMDGGPIMDYIKYFYHDKNNAILLTGYQAEESNGRRLLEHGYVEVDNKTYDVKAFVKKFDFSAHSGQKELIEMIKGINPKHLILNHGDPEEMNEFILKLKSVKEIHVPVLGEVVRV